MPCACRWLICSATGLHGHHLLAWNLKAWFGLLLPNGQRGAELIKMQFRRFLQAIVLLPAQIVRTGRRVIYRIMSYNRWLKDLFAAWSPAPALCYLAK